MSTLNSTQINAIPLNGNASAAATAVGVLAIDSRSSAPSIMDVRTIAVAKLGVEIYRLVAGDTWKLIRTYTGLQTGVTISKVYFTVKNAATDTDANAIFQKSITGTLTSSGQITTATTTAGTIVFNIIASRTDTALLTPEVEYYYDLQGIGSDGAVYTFETGTVTPQRGVTDASS